MISRKHLIALVAIFTCLVGYARIPSLPFSPLSAHSKNIYWYKDDGGIKGQARMVVSSNNINELMHGENVVRQFNLIWTVNGHSLSDSPLEYYECVDGLLWIEKQIKINSQGELISNSPFLKHPSSVELIDSGSDWMLGKKNLGKWRTYKITEYTGVYSKITLSEREGLLCEEEYNSKGVLLNSVKLIKQVVGKSK